MGKKEDTNEALVKQQETFVNLTSVTTTTVQPSNDSASDECCAPVDKLEMFHDFRRLSVGNPTNSFQFSIDILLGTVPYCHLTDWVGSHVEIPYNTLMFLK